MYNETSNGFEEVRPSKPVLWGGEESKRMGFLIGVNSWFSPSSLKTCSETFIVSMWSALSHS